MFSFDPAVPETKINEGQVWPNLTDYAMNNSVVALPDNMEMRGSQTQQLSEKKSMMGVNVWLSDMHNQNVLKYTQKHLITALQTSLHLKSARRSKFVYQQAQLLTTVMIMVYPSVWVLRTV